MTAAAVREYQSAAGLPGDGQVSNLLVDHIAKAVETRQVVRAQRRLIDLGYDAGPIDGTAGPRTRSAVEAFQEATGGAKDGRITPQLLAALRRPAPRRPAPRRPAPRRPAPRRPAPRRPAPRRPAPRRPPPKRLAPRRSR
jgi:peptidoglycan hydrolase-like protein with peptidoglycan-binding domain